MKKLFSRFGGVLGKHGPTFVFVHFPTVNEAEAALSLDKHVLSDGLSLRVVFAQVCLEDESEFE